MVLVIITNLIMVKAAVVVEKMVKVVTLLEEEHRRAEEEHGPMVLKMVLPCMEVGEDLDLMRVVAVVDGLAEQEDHILVVSRGTVSMTRSCPSNRAVA